MELIAIGGLMQSGKDTTANLIIKLRKDKSWKILRFADAVKDIVCILLYCTREDLEDIDFKNKELDEEWDRYYLFGSNPVDKQTIIKRYKEEHSINPSQYWLDSQKLKMTPRLLLQLIGTECGRNIIHPDIWVNCLKKKYYQFKNQYNIIIPDLRFNNEANFVKENNGKIIIVEREEIINIESIKSIKNHSSENSLALDPSYSLIKNNGTISDLTIQIEKILTSYKI